MASEMEKRAHESSRLLIAAMFELGWFETNREQFETSLARELQDFAASEVAALQAQQPFVVSLQCIKCGVVRHQRLQNCVCGEVETVAPMETWKQLQSAKARVAELESRLRISLALQPHKPSQSS